MTCMTIPDDRTVTVAIKVAIRDLTLDLNGNANGDEVRS